MAEVDVFAAIASQVRRVLLDALRSGPLAVHQLADDFAVSRERRYRLQPRPLREVTKWVSHYEQFWSTRLTALRDLLDEQT